MSSPRIRIDHRKCAGSTMCVLTAPGVFALDEKGQSVVVDASAASDERIAAAVGECPMGAITLVCDDEPA